MGNGIIRLIAAIQLLCAIYLYHTGQEWQFTAFAASFFAIAGNWRG
jgi:hypothetical protein